MKVTQKAVTFEAEQFYTANGVANIEEMLKDSRVRIKEYGGRAELSWPPSSNFYQNGPSESVWGGNWIVLSSLGDVRNLSEAQYDKEFYEDWEVPETVEDRIALLAKYVYRAVNKGHVTVDPGDWNRLESLERGTE